MKLKSEKIDKKSNKLSKESFLIFKSWGSFSRRSVSRVFNNDTIEKDDEDLEKDIKDLISESFQKLEIPKYLLKYPNN